MIIKENVDSSVMFTCRGGNDDRRQKWEIRKIEGGRDCVSLLVLRKEKRKARCT